MNAILQSLFSLPSFSNDLLKQGIPWKRVPVNALLRYGHAVVFSPSKLGTFWTILNIHSNLKRKDSPVTSLLMFCFCFHIKAFRSSAGQERYFPSRSEERSFAASEERYFLNC